MINCLPGLGGHEAVTDKGEMSAVRGPGRHIDGTLPTEQGGDYARLTPFGGHEP